MCLTKDMFLMANQVHSCNTRNSNLFYLFSAQTNIRPFGIKFQGPKFFISLNNNIQSAPTLNITCSLVPLVCFVHFVCFFLLFILINNFIMILLFFLLFIFSLFRLGRDLYQ